MRPSRPHRDPYSRGDSCPHQGKGDPECPRFRQVLRGGADDMRGPDPGRDVRRNRRCSRRDRPELGCDVRVIEVKPSGVEASPPREVIDKRGLDQSAAARRQDQARRKSRRSSAVPERNSAREKPRPGRAERVDAVHRDQMMTSDRARARRAIDEKARKHGQRQPGPDQTSVGSSFHELTHPGASRPVGNATQPPSPRRPPPLASSNSLSIGLVESRAREH